MQETIQNHSHFDMKLIAIILSIYVLVLTAIPCTDTHISESSSVSVELSEHSHNQFDNIDSCTPFCYCNCCQSISLISVYNNQIISFSTIELEFPILVQAEIGQLKTFWKPPKI